MLNESGMENHPLDADDRRRTWCACCNARARSKVGLMRYDTVARKGADEARARIDELRDEGVRLAIADAMSDADLLTRWARPARTCS